MSNVLNNGFKNTAADTIEAVYTDQGEGTVITAFSATNNTINNRIYRAYIYDSTGNAIDSPVPHTIVKTKRYNLGAPLIGKVIPAGGSLRVESDLADSLFFQVSGDKL